MNFPLAEAGVAPRPCSSLSDSDGDSGSPRQPETAALSAPASDMMSAMMFPPSFTPDLQAAVIKSGVVIVPAALPETKK